MPRVVAEGRVADIAARVSSVHAVASLPSGYPTTADHLLILITEVAPYQWEAEGVLERDGRIVGLVGECHGSPSRMYPPRSILVPLPDGDLTADRRSGIAVVDATLDALRVGDADVLYELADPSEAGCVEEVTDFGSPPECEGDETPGTSLEVVAVGQCHGWLSRRSDVADQLAQGANPEWRLYAVHDIGDSSADSFARGRYHAVFVRPIEGSEELAAFALLFTDEGFANVRFGCGVVAPGTLMYTGRDPVFLLAPPI